MIVEPQYQALLEVEPSTLGLMANHTWAVDPKRLGFTLARYKFVAKMLAGTARVLEVGCADGWASRVVAQHVESLFCIDMDEELLASAPATPGVVYSKHDMVAGPRYVPDRVVTQFDAAFALDVLEHISPAVEGAFLGNICNSITRDGVLIIGTPSLESQAHASSLSVAGHVNCKTHEGLRQTMLRYFSNVFMFGMNDETLHTGYGSMCHYLFAVCAAPKT